MIQEIWRGLWGALPSSLRVTELARSYLSYLDANKQYLTEAISDALERPVSFPTSLSEYVAWVTLGPSLAEGYRDYLILVDLEPEIEHIILDLATLLLEDPLRWETEELRVLRDTGKRNSRALASREPTLEFAEAMVAVFEEVQHLVDSRTLDSSYIFGVSKMHKPTDPPPCKSSAVRIVLNGMQEGLFSRTLVDVSQYIERGPRDLEIPFISSWIDQEQTFRESLANDLVL